MFKRLFKPAHRSPAADTGQAWLDRAGVLFRSERIIEARSLCERAFEAGLRSAALHSQLGWACLKLGDIETAVTAFRRAAALEPDAPKAHYDLGVALQAIGRFDEAAASYSRSIEAGGADFDCLLGLSDVALAQGRPADAEPHARTALRLDPQGLAAWNHLGVALDRQRRYDEAIDAFARAEQLEREGGAARRDAFANLGNCLLEAGRAGDAIDVFRRNLPAYPSINGHFLYALCLLTAGRFEEGWQQYEFRRMRDSAIARRAKVRKPTWSGQDLAGRTILLRTEQGIGDSIQFVRYAPLLKDLGATVILHPQPEIAKLAQAFDGVDSIIEEGLAPPYDYHADLLSLPGVCGTREASIPDRTPYVRVPAEAARRWASIIPAGAPINAGLVWAGSSGHIKDRFRSLELQILAPLAAIDGVSYYSLQKGAAAAEAISPPAGMRVVDLSAELGDFIDTAAAISRLDVVIAVDTAVAHLAGALGKPVFMLVPKPTDWRWQESAEGTRWYPTMRLFRQSQRDAWPEVIGKVCRALADLVARRSPIPPRASTPVAAPSAQDSEAVPLCSVAETHVGILQVWPGVPEMARSLAYYGEYSLPQLRSFLRLLRQGATAVLVGDSCAAHALASAETVGPGGHVFTYISGTAQRVVVRQNLRANDVRNVTLLDEANPDTATIDMLSLDGLDAIKIEGHAADVAGAIEGANDTIWRLRPAIFATVREDGEVATAWAGIKTFGYRGWRASAPYFDPDNFNGRVDDIFDGRRSTAILAIPEEVDIVLPSKDWIVID